MLDSTPWMQDLHFSVLGVHDDAISPQQLMLRYIATQYACSQTRSFRPISALLGPTSEAIFCFVALRLYGAC